MDRGALLAETMRRMTATILSLPGRPKDPEGRPGGLVELSAHERIVIVGDLHASMESLSAILEQSGIAADLGLGKARLVFLGDIVHDDRPGHLAEMATSVEILERIGELILNFPGKIVWLRGNHDGFDPPLTKGWVRQGEVFRDEMESLGGGELVRTARELFDALPLAVVAESLILVHAGPPRGGMNAEAVVSARPGSALATEMVWNRICPDPGEPGCYSPEDIRASFDAFGMKKEGAFFIVGHNPLWSMGDGSGLWPDVGMRGHHILYSGALGRAPWLNLEEGRLTGRFARVRGLTSSSSH